MSDTVITVETAVTEITVETAGQPGPPGAQGTAGPTGAQGPAGTDGTDGVTGATGPAGAAGSTGATGATGPAGTNGADGADGQSFGDAWRGDWDGATTYAVGDLVRVRSTGVLAIATAPSTNVQPPSTLAAGEFGTFYPTPPSTATDPDSDSYELAVRFRVLIACTITGIRWYRGGSSNTADTVSLWRISDTTLLDSAVTAAVVDGWNLAEFASPFTPVIGVEYYASYTCPAGKYSVTTGALASAVDNGVVRTLGGAFNPAPGSMPAVSSASWYGVEPVAAVAPTGLDTWDVLVKGNPM